MLISLPCWPPRRRRRPSRGRAATLALALAVTVVVLQVAVTGAAIAQPRPLAATAALAGRAPSAPATAGPVAPGPSVVEPAAGLGARAGPAWGWPMLPRPPLLRPFQPPPAPWLPGHRGVDLGGAPASAVRAAGAGVVAFAGSVAGVPVVSVDHPGGLRTTYQPVVAEVRRGSAVRLGDVLGRLAAAPSHCAPLACLHWGLRRGDDYLDPLALVGVDLRVRLLPLWDP